MHQNKKLLIGLSIGILYLGIGAPLMMYLGRNDAAKIRAKINAASIHSRIRKIEMVSQLPLVAFKNDNN